MTGVLEFAALTVVLVGLLFGLEALVRRARWRHETTRRIAHVLACLYAVVAHSLLPLWAFVLACTLFLLALVVSRRRGLLSAVHVTRRDSLGEVYLPGGIVIAALAGGVAGSHSVFLASILILAIADVAAGVTGDLLKSDRKTRLGSLAFFAVSLLVVQACGFSPFVSLATAAVATAVERISSRGTDNLTVPFVAGALLVVLPPLVP